jgi:hypothetical protein
MTIEPARSLVVTDRAVLDSPPGGLFALQRVFDQLVAQSHVPGLTRQGLWQQWWTHLGPQCTTSLNGFPLDCPRAEGTEATLDPFDPQGPVFYQTTALVNRFDLAPVDGTHCGEYRLVFARTPVVGFHPRNLLIFEAVLPNPAPYLGLEGCRPVAAFWASLSVLDDPQARAQALAEFYFTGLPGFPPVVTIAHYGTGTGTGTGQIRTNGHDRALRHRHGHGPDSYQYVYRAGLAIARVPTRAPLPEARTSGALPGPAHRAGAREKQSLRGAV